MRDTQALTSLPARSGCFWSFHFAAVPAVWGNCIRRESIILPDEVSVMIAARSPRHTKGVVQRGGGDAHQTSPRIMFTRSDGTAALAESSRLGLFSRDARAWLRNPQPSRTMVAKSAT